MSQVRQCGHRVAITLISMLHRQRSAEQYFGMAADEENITGAAERSDAHRRAGHWRMLLYLTSRKVLKLVRREALDFLEEWKEREDELVA